MKTSNPVAVCSQLGACPRASICRSFVHRSQLKLEKAHLPTPPLIVTAQLARSAASGTDFYMRWSGASFSMSNHRCRRASIADISAKLQVSEPRCWRCTQGSERLAEATPEVS